MIERIASLDNGVFKTHTLMCVCFEYVSLTSSSDIYRPTYTCISASPIINNGKKL